MSTTAPAWRGDDQELIVHSPDGESRGLMFRVGDIFPMDPRPHQRAMIDEAATEARPWGLRFLRVPMPRAGKREKGTSDFTTNGREDNQGPEDSDKD